MGTDENKLLVRFLLDASRTSLGSFLLDRHNRAAELERELREQVHRLVETLGELYLAQLLREHGEELAATLGAPRRRRPR